MATNPQAGKEITADQANNYLGKYVEIRSNLKKEVIPLNQTKQITALAKNDVNTFYSSPVNAFIFSKELLMRFFDTTKSKDEQAEYLMVISSAKYEGVELGNPTIVVAGVNKNDVGD